LSIGPFAEANDYTADIGTEDDGHLNTCVQALGDVNISVVEGGGLDLDQHLSWVGDGLGQLFQYLRAVKGFKD
jgi:hypothetical protein